MISDNTGRFPKRKWTPPVDSTAIHQAQKENFAIFQLKGLRSVVNSPIVRAMVASTIRLKLSVIIEEAMTDVLNKQEIRMRKAGTTRRSKLPVSY
jgi:hypothetical protein